ncbi:PilZ domain-containing protein [Nitrospira moscoviensis]|jgi:hypothetical protein|uniref:PilZ domain-containing protein n=1 Tax=Nitrospira moscoviensis TaxID=42253 RepID=A0A0K2GD75_NITMO|nr:PilZ domain-containing protein [Nitrospira moscoviensis]ALA58562.1 hypothetical protein NITMOv2_2145 [Nitrospira moscoviensis]
MPRSSTNLPSVPPSVAQDERREWLRIDDRLLLEYRLVTEPADRPAPGVPAVTQDMIAAAVAKPTAELLARNGELLAGSPILPWIMKVDWLLEVMLKAMAVLHPESMDIARVTDVNISGGGIGFASARRFESGDRLSVKIILPPFTPVHTVAKVIRCAALANGQAFDVATQFEQLSADDQEHIIQHIIRTQAERLRARRQQTA